MFWLRNKENNFQLRTLIWGPELWMFVINPFKPLAFYLWDIDEQCRTRPERVRFCTVYLQNIILKFEREFISLSNNL